MNSESVVHCSLSALRILSRPGARFLAALLLLSTFLFSLPTVSEAANTWSTLAVATDTVGAGGSLVYPGSGDTIYAFRGDVFTTFWAYSIKNNTWTTMASAPATMFSGGSLVYPGSGDTIYAFRGSQTTTFWAYTVPFYSGPNWYVNDASTAGGRCRGRCQALSY